ncbi:DedA family protein [Longimicrobium terrae]|uniref:Membrane protein DedA with SNARE-associated domain n=1 Tax=Longimicrobium terrae TaxID=1639882 RepID=A0A841H4S6_9BACT|nr:DedA family protein [Longimicrobium terrae]MBB4638703.1 membrane protein DedA with SNARE-associated domain [Longimicrobium terrae]MBB6072942.1 membrane protein DedA with SNARE-associated domain [Longimicrobium terrae]NNC31554.1 DedA family protein [Longimicrobium terrae]
MGGLVDRLIEWMQGLSEALVYVVIGLFAAVENVFPPVPADAIALTGGFLAGQGVVNPWIAFLIVWICNVAGALLVYWLGRRYGPALFDTRAGRFLVQPKQMARLASVYDRHGAKVIFVSRFLPAFRAVVPIFAGTTGMSFWRAAVPIAVASGAWYGLIVYLGATAGQNWDRIRAAVDASGRWLAIAAAILAVIVVWFWWKSRKQEE